MFSHLKRYWRRWLIFGAALSTVTLFYLVATRFYFSHEQFPALARWQRNGRADDQLHVEPPQIIGHRGSGLRSSNGKWVIGNTANAIQHGIDAEVDWIEMDVQLTKDNHLIVFHDQDLSQKTNGKGKVSEATLAHIRSLSVNVDPPENVLTLDEVFSKFNSKERKWIFDIKSTGIQDHVLRWIEDKISTGQLSPKQFILFGSYAVLVEYKDSGFSLGFTATLGNLWNRLAVIFWPSRIMDRAQFLDCDYLVLPVFFANDNLIRTAIKKRKVWVYGTDKKLDIVDLANRGVSGFIVDQPESVMTFLSSQ